MAKLKTDSPLSRRIALSFLHFLSSVEPAAGVDTEALEVAKDCLAEVFKIDQSSVESQSKCDSLIDIFSSRDQTSDGGVADAPSTSSTKNRDNQEAARSQDDDQARELHSLGQDELFGQFFDALERVHYFKRAPDGSDDQALLDRATNIFHNALEEMENSGCGTVGRKNLAETLKSKGNQAMQSKLYTEAIELYTFAIALIDNNAVYYCNRAAAYTQTRRYAEAVQDCLKSIEINPSYSKAYSRLGFAYYAQGNYRDAIDKGFAKALQLDPGNESVKENIRAAEQKLKDEQERARNEQTHQRESNHQFAGGSRGPFMPPPFSSMPFGPGGLPSDITNMFMNMASNAYEGEHARTAPEGDSNSNSPNEPEIRIGGNINLNVGELPAEVSGALRSVMEMFSGATSHGNPEHDTNERTGPS